MQEVCGYLWIQEVWYYCTVLDMGWVLPVGGTALLYCWGHGLSTCGCRRCCTVGDMGLVLVDVGGMVLLGTWDKYLQMQEVQHYFRADALHTSSSVGNDKVAQFCGLALCVSSKVPTAALLIGPVLFHVVLLFWSHYQHWAVKSYHCLRQENPATTLSLCDILQSVSNTKSFHPG